MQIILGSIAVFTIVGLASRRFGPWQQVFVVGLAILVALTQFLVPNRL